MMSGSVSCWLGAPSGPSLVAVASDSGMNGNSSSKERKNKAAHGSFVIRACLRRASLTTTTTNIKQETEHVLA